MSPLRVLILGSGAGGLFLARELSQIGCAVTVASEQPLAQFSSTRNQGWLQAGALYAGLGQPSVARECRLASAAICRLVPSAVDHHRRCFYFFERQNDANTFAEACGAAGIEIRSPSRTRSVPSLGSIQAGSPYNWAVEAFDRPFNTSVVLRAVRNQAIRSGCEFTNVSLLPGCIHKTSSEWILAASGKKFEKVILAAGAETAALASALGCAMAYGALWITVLDVVGVALDSMLLSPEPYHPNIVPFASALGSGFTAILAKADINGPVDASRIPAERKKIEDGIATFFPAIWAAIQTSGGTSGTHACTKLAATVNPTARGVTIEALTNSGDLWAFYPGKFTTAVLAARDCARAVLGHPLGAIDVADQPYP